MKTIKLQRNNQGFTLIELMVVVAIIAILAVVGLTLFTSTQRSARDSRRQQDIQSVTKAFETHYQATVPSNCDDGDNDDTTIGPPIAAPGYCPLMEGWFAATLVPTDPLGANGTYCINSNDTGATIADPTPADWATSTGTCPTTPTGYVTLTDTLPAIGGSDIPANTWKVCARMEVSGAIYCVPSSQR